MKRIILIVALVLSVSVAYGASSKTAIPIPSPTIGNAVGRFVLVQLSTARRDQYMVDTQTGRLWSIEEIKDQSQFKDRVYTILSPVHYLSTDGKLYLEPQTITESVEVIRK